MTAGPLREAASKASVQQAACHVEKQHAEGACRGSQTFRRTKLPWSVTTILHSAHAGPLQHAHHSKL